MVDDGFTLYEEVDYFFFFLYDRHPEKPSKEYTKEVRSLKSKEKKIRQIRRYFKSMPYAPGSGQWRLERRDRIREILPFEIQSPKKKEIREVLDRLHCLDSYGWNKSNILDENDPRSIAKAWNRLIQAPSINAQLIKEVIGKIKYFGMSSACELIGCYYYDTYPKINRVSESGMRFFGFDI